MNSCMSKDTQKVQGSFSEQLPVIGKLRACAIETIHLTL